ncbi:hypothetical protein [Streptomyces sp. NPDC046978]|uniref:hypothetical protein n=1 Tax=Streptomyces sp. NPDC046978 TaxID=3154704 RepID=UPI003410A751
MPEPLATVAAGLELAIIGACLYLYYLRKCISRRSTIGLLALAAVLAAVRAVALHKWPLAAVSIPAAIILALAWLIPPRSIAKRAGR